jgi:hypothetical protein
MILWAIRRTVLRDSVEQRAAEDDSALEEGNTLVSRGGEAACLCMSTAKARRSFGKTQVHELSSTLVSKD